MSPGDLDSMLALADGRRLKFGYVSCVDAGIHLLARETKKNGEQSQ
jgi:hypothetical protein